MQRRVKVSSEILMRQINHNIFSTVKNSNTDFYFFGTKPSIFLYITWLLNGYGVLSVESLAKKCHKLRGWSDK